MLARLFASPLAIAGSLVLAWASPARTAPRPIATVVLHVTTRPARPVRIYLRELRDGAKLAKACNRAPCDVTVARGKRYLLEASISGATGSISVVSDRAKQVVIPLRPAGLPPVRPTPLPPSR